MGVEPAFIGRKVFDFAPVPVANQGRGGRAIKTNIHVPRKRHHLLVGRPQVEHEIMVVIVGIVVPHAAERIEGESAHPLIDIHQLPRVRFEVGPGGGRQAESFSQAEEAAVIIVFPVVLNDKIVPVNFFVGTEVGDIDADDVVRRRKLVSAGIGSGGVIIQFHFPFNAAGAVLISRRDELVLKSRGHQSRAGLRVDWRNDVADIRLPHRNAPGAQGDMHHHHLDFGNRWGERRRAIDEHDWMNAAE